MYMSHLGGCQHRPTKGKSEWPVDGAASNDSFKYDALPGVTFSNPCWEGSLKRDFICIFDNNMIIALLKILVLV